jgi:gluconokinase
MLYSEPGAIISNHHSDSSPFDQVNGIVYFGRMLDKIRLAAAGKLPEGWQAMRGTPTKGTFDSRCCQFLHIDYIALEAETLKGRSDEELLAWVFANGRQPSEEEIEVWNAFMTKRGWRDAGTQRLDERLGDRPATGHSATMFEFIDLMKAGVRVARGEVDRRRSFTPCSRSYFRHHRHVHRGRQWVHCWRGSQPARACRVFGERAGVALRRGGEHDEAEASRRWGRNPIRVQTNSTIATVPPG